MCREILICMILVSASMATVAQNDWQMDAIMKVLGVEDPESADPGETDRLASLLERPIAINCASEQKLVSSGLFTRFQVASLLDYRERHGDILSMYELSSVDGFNESVAEVLKPFISLKGDIGHMGSYNVENDLVSRSGVKISKGQTSGSYALKYRLQAGETFSMAASVSSSDLSYPYFPDIYSGYVELSSPKLSSRVIIGDFNARFGQGLAIWNGMTMSGFKSLQSFYRSSSGLSPSWSFTGSSSMTGVALETILGRFTVNTFLSCPGVKNMKSSPERVAVNPAVNVCWKGRFFSVSGTHYSVFPAVLSQGLATVSDMKTSLDMGMCIRGTDIFAEVTYDWFSSSVAAVSSLLFPLGDEVRMAMNFRYYPSDFNSSYSASPRGGSTSENELGVAACCHMHGFERIEMTVSSDVFVNPRSKDERVRTMQASAFANIKLKFNELWTMSFRWNERFRTWGRPFRTDLRADLSYDDSVWFINARMNFLQCMKISFLAYGETGYRNEKCSAYCRMGAFCVDEWDDRIYVYERDAPGSFNVPAFYGRGIWMSLTSSWRFSSWGRLYARASFTSYPFMKKQKPGKAELKIQGTFSF